MVRINLLPVKVSKKKEAGKQQLVLFLVLLVAGVVANGLWSSNRNAELQMHQRRLVKTRTDIEALDRIIGEVKSIRTQQQDLRDKLNVLEKLKEGRSGPVRMLDELATIVPKRVWLRRLAQRGGVVAFEASAVSIDDVSAFMSALKQSQHFTNVELKRTEARTQGAVHTVDFLIETAVHYGPPATTTAAQAPRPAGG